MIRFLIQMVLLFSFSLKVFSSQLAIVKAKMAIVYADRALAQPIGKLKQGTKIKVGNEPRRAFSIIPVYIKNGRVAYIRMIDIQLNPKESDDYTVMNLEHELVFETPEEFEHLITLALNTDDPGEKYSQLAQSAQSSSPEGNLLGAAIGFERHELKYSSYFEGRYGFNYMSDEAVELQNIFVDIDLGYNLFDNLMFSVGPLAGIKIHPLVSLKVKDDSTPNKGSAWGYFAGVKIRLFPHSSVNVHIDARFQSSYVDGINDVETGGETLALKQLSGFSVNAGVGFLF